MGHRVLEHGCAPAEEAEGQRYDSMGSHHGGPAEVCSIGRQVDPNNQLTEGRDMLKRARVIGTALVLVLAITVLMHSAAVRPAWADELDDDAAAALR